MSCLHVYTLVPGWVGACVTACALGVYYQSAETLVYSALYTRCSRCHHSHTIAKHHVTSSPNSMTSFRLLCQCLIVTCLLATFSHERAVVIETGPVYDYVYVDDYGVYVTQGRQISFNIRASNDAHIALARLKYNTTVDAYEVVIGGWYNQRSTIRPCDQCPTDWWVDQRLLKETYPMPFWVTWALNVSGGLTIRTGSGYVVLQNEFMSWYDPDPHDINYVGVSTGWASNGTWIFEVGQWPEMVLPPHLGGDSK